MKRRGFKCVKIDSYSYNVFCSPNAHCEYTGERRIAQLLDNSR